MKTSPRALWKFLREKLIKLDFDPSDRDLGLYTRVRKVNGKEEMTIVCQYVDDLLYLTSSREAAETFISDLRANDVALDPQENPRNYLGYQITYTNDAISLDINGYLKKLMEKYDSDGEMRTECMPYISGFSTKELELSCEKAPAATAQQIQRGRQLVGELLYAGQKLHASLGPVLSAMASTVLKCSSKMWWSTGQHILRYLKGCLNQELAITYKRRKPGDTFLPRLTVCSDASFNNDSKSRSLVGEAVFLDDGLISWSTAVTRTIVLSTVEAETWGASQAGKSLLYYQLLLSQIGVVSEPGILAIDSMGCIKNMLGGSSARTGHMHYRERHLMHCAESGLMHITHVYGDRNPADILSKGMREYQQFEFLRQVFFTSKRKYSWSLDRIASKRKKRKKISSQGGKTSGSDVKTTTTSTVTTAQVVQKRVKRRKVFR